MSHNVEYVKDREERGEHIERVVEIYESVGAVQSHNGKKQLKDVNKETQQTGMHTFCETPDIIKEQKCTREMEDTNPVTKKNIGRNTAWNRCYRATVMCVLLLCALLLSAIAVLWIKFNTLTTEKNQLQTRYSTLTIDRDQLQISYNTLTIERDHLQTSNHNLTIERHYLQKEKELCNRGIQQRCVQFNSSVYCIFTDEKNWNESRQTCKDIGQDLMIIKSKVEQDIISQLLSVSKVWIGLSDSEVEGEWKWVDNTSPTTLDWNKGEPNNVGNEDCAVLVVNPSGKSFWNDVQCSAHKTHWICQKHVYQ